MNKSILFGTVIQTPNISQIGNGTKIANYRLQVHKEGKKNKFDKINCTAFGADADYAEGNIYEGVQVLITGHLQSNNYTNKHGEKVYTTEVVVESQEIIR